MSPAQAAVLRFLARRPDVELSCCPGLTRMVQWTRYECWDPHPRITAPTFGALQRQGLLQMTRYQSHQGAWALVCYYTISRAGVKALLAEAEPAKTEAT